MYFALYDKYGNIVSTDVSSKLYLSAVQNYSYNFTSSFDTVTTFSVTHGAFILD